jgi:hypothetical protein
LRCIHLTNAFVFKLVQDSCNALNLFRCIFRYIHFKNLWFTSCNTFSIIEVYRSKISKQCAILAISNSQRFRQFLKPDFTFLFYFPEECALLSCVSANER